jgi:serine phosphatase RsbU (regulator of sigma subunit)
MQLNINFTPASVEIGVLILLLLIIIALMLYRRFPVHLIYRSKIGFESMLDAVDEPLAVISKDFTVKRANKAYIEMIKRSYKASINAKCYSLLRDRSSPCDDCRLSETIERSANHEVENSPHPCGSGSLNITFSPYAMPIGGSTAEICVIEHIRDITALEKLKNDLERRNNFLVTLTNRLRAARRSIKAELRVAHQLQIGLLPSKPPRLDRMRIDMTYRPAEDVGGDLYDFVRIADKKLGVFIGDASGHGLAASLIGTLSKMSLYNHSKAWLPTMELLERMNKDLNAHIHTSHYLTCFWCVFDFEKNVMTYSRAGHPMQIVLRKDGTVHELSGGGIFLGITDDALYEQKEFAFENGDRFFWFTDGIYDVFKKNRNGGNDGRGELLGYDKFVNIIKQTTGTPFGNVIEEIKNSLTDFKHEDDYTLIVAEICDE